MTQGNRKAKISTMTNQKYSTVMNAIQVFGMLFILFMQAGKLQAQAPVASFGQNDSIGCAPLSVQFVNNSSNGVSYFWDFGNGNTSTLINPSIIYTNIGNYTVTLIVTNALGQIDTLIKNSHISVIARPTADFTAGPLTSCINTQLVVFNNLSVNASSYIWDFGDGSSSALTNPSHAYTTPGIYNVKLIATDAYGCNDIKIRNSYITIHPKPVSAFSASPTSACQLGQVFNFTSASPGSTSYLWNFGDGTTSTQANPTKTYTAFGAYTITLVVTNSNGCKDTLIKTNYINIQNNLPASFTSNSTMGCPPYTISFASTTANATSWNWNFGNGLTSTLENPSSIYSTVGNFNVSLTTTSASGCTSSVSMPNYISMQAGPTSNFSASTVVGCKPLSVTFTNSSTNGNTYLWDFGNGQTSTLPNPTVLFNNAGNFSITLTTISANGCEDIKTISNMILVRQSSANFTASPITGCPALTVNFTCANSGSNNQWDWNFGDPASGAANTSTLQNPTHIYSAIGNYTVSLITTNSFGCKDTIIRSNYVKVVNPTSSYTPPAPNYQCAPYTAQCLDPTTGSSGWLWDFGDGTTSTMQNPSHTYNNPGTYVVTLVTQMAGGCSQTFSPYAVYNIMGVTITTSVSASVGLCPPFLATFTSSAPGATGWSWTFGDGDSSTLQNPSHTYLAPGLYNVNLLAFSPGPASITGVGDVQCTTSTSLNITVGVTNPITANQTEVCTSDTIQFNCSLNNMASYLWDFKDGTTSTQKNPKKLYSTVGTYSVTLTVTDSSGCSQTFTISPIVKVNNPLADFSITSSTSGCNSVSITLANTSTNATSYLWNFGNGVTSNLQNPTYTYTTPGTYTITLTAIKNNCSQTKSISNAITVNAANANFTFTQNRSCFPITATFTSLSTNATSWMWDFGDGTSSTLQNPVHIYNSPPSGNINLTINDSNGCSGTKSSPNVNYFVSDFTASNTSGCAPLITTFTDITQNAISWLWIFGDGNTSTVQNPVHMYTAGGAFDVTLIAQSTTGCYDTIVYPVLVNVIKPKAEFYTPTVAACAPTLVNFIDQSIDAVSWYYDFGDGTNSTSQNPSHIYNIAGFYTITQIVTNSIGCIDTLIKVDYIAIPGPVSNFSVAPTSGCTTLEAHFTDLSYNAISWNWSFGDGSSSTLQNPINTYSNVGSYTVTLITQDSLGCQSFFTYPGPLSVYPSPTAMATATGTQGCNPYTVVFNEQSSGATTFEWNFGDGGTSTLPNPTYVYLNAGSYYASLIVSNNFGCTDTFVFASPFVVDETPVPDFTVDVNIGCPPLIANFMNNSSQLFGASYFWDFGNGTTSTATNPSVSYPLPGIYNVSLVVTNSNGCSDTMSLPNMIRVNDTIPPAITNILSVTVTSNTTVQISWEQNTAIDLESYVLYRYNQVNGSFDPIRVINNPNSTTFTLDTMVVDSSLNTLDNVYTYKLLTRDICGYEIGLDQLTAHSTINVSAIANNLDINVTWNAYGGCSVSQYDILRTDLISGATVKVGTVPGNVFEFLDTDIPCPRDYSYLIIGNDLCSKPYISLSDTSVARPIDFLSDQQVEIIRSTVEGDKYVYTEWKAPVNFPDKVAYYNVYRYTNNSNYTFVTSIPVGNQNYLDMDVDVKANKYQYEVKAMNNCDVNSLMSNPGVSVLLKAQRVNDTNVLTWTPYFGWDTDVDYYIIEKQDIHGNWKFLKKTNPNTVYFEDK